MDFRSSGREGFHEEEQIGKGELFFSCPSSSCSSSQRETQLAPLGNSQWEQLPHQIYGSPNWFGNRHEPEEDIEPTAKETTSGADRKRVDSDSTLELRSNESGNIIEKEHMFDKVVTPSDVGKLNRLVVPKLHAEKYFPLDSSANEKGLMLNFEDRNGKPWRFRYSYWNSSQSYVMTKGWSRFVKDKKLDAGDIVSFQRGVGELGKDRLFIDWRRRPHGIHPHHQHQFSSLHRSIQWSPLLMLPRRPPPETRRDHHLQYLSQIKPLNRNSYYGGYPTVGSNVVNGPGGVFYLRSAMAAAAAAPPKMGMGMMERQQQGGVVKAAPIVFDSVPVVQAKRLRLFGVNMECPISQSNDCDMLSTTTVANPTMASQLSQLSSSSQHHLHLKLYNGTPMARTDFLNANKRKASMSLDFDIVTTRN